MKKKRQVKNAIRFLEKLKKLEKKYGVWVDGWVVTPDYRELYHKDFKKILKELEGKGDTK